jgi:hypothetical protein
MTFQEEIADLRRRIAKAQSDRDTWRDSGKQENYLEAYSMVEALELQLEGMRRQGLLAFGESQHPAAGPVAAGPSDERERLMSEHSITFNGRHYQFGRYRYDHLADAVSYSLLQRSMPRGSHAADLGDPEPMPEEIEAPDRSQRALMDELDISFSDGAYHLGAYRYDRLADAVAYARVQHREQG